MQDKPETEELSAITGGFVDDIAGSWTDALLSNQDDPILARKAGDLKIYEKVLADDQVHSTFQQRRNALTAKQVEVRAGGTDAASLKAADFIREMIENLSFDRITNRMMYGLFYGYAVGECLWIRDSRNWTLSDIKVRKARRFRFDKAGGLRLLKQGQPSGVLMPERKFWTFEAGSDNDDNPYGVGLGAYCYWPCFFKRTDIKFWLIALQKFGSPTPIGKFPPNTSQKDKEKLLEALMALQSSTAMAVPENMLIDLLQSGAKVGGNYETLHSVMNASIAKVILSQTMTTDNGSSMSQANVHMEVREEVTATDADLLCGSFNAGPVKWLTEWNFPGAIAPIVRRQVEQPEDVDKLAARDQKLFAMGWEPTEARIRETYGDGYQRRQLPASSDPNKPAPAEFAIDDLSADPIDAIDRFLASDDHAKALDEETDGFLVEIELALKTAENPDEAKLSLMKLLGVPENDPFVERLAQASFAARIHGRAVAEPNEQA